MVVRYSEEQIKNNKEVVKDTQISFQDLGNFHLKKRKTTYPKVRYL